MKQSLKKAKLYGAKGFDSYYEGLFKERWPLLKKSLEESSPYAEVKAGGQKSYFLDPASVCASLSLKIEDDSSSVADLCAAPGGKSLVITSFMKDNVFLYSNERSAERKKRLELVIKDSLSEDVARRVKVSLSDASLWAKKSPLKEFDSVLLDAPCSSERHVLSAAKYLEVWSPSRIKGLAVEQWALLSCAWRILRKGGFLVYATCALSPAENEGVVLKLKKKFEDVEYLSEGEVKNIFLSNLKAASKKIIIPSEYGFSLEDVFDSADRKEAGLHILPDASFGCGPLYFCALRKMGDA